MKIPHAPPLPDEVVEVRDVVRRFGDRAALDGVSLSVREPECFGLLGPNGAGKTTLLRILHGVLPPTAGAVRILWRDLSDRRNARIARSMMGIVHQHDTNDPDLSVHQSLVVFGRFFGFGRAFLERRADELLAWVRLSDRRADPVADLSGGMKRRLMLARALLHKPKILVLDEPTTGLDPHARLLLWDKIRELKKQSVTVVLSTHDMAEAEALCDRLVVMDRGQILAEGSPRDLVAKHLAPRCVSLTAPHALPRTVDARVSRLATRNETRGAERLFFARDARPLLRALSRVPHQELRERSANLEDVFVALTGRDLRE